MSSITTCNANKLESYRVRNLSNTLCFNSARCEHPIDMVNHINSNRPDYLVFTNDEKTGQFGNKLISSKESYTQPRVYDKSSMMPITYVLIDDLEKRQTIEEWGCDPTRCPPNMNCNPMDGSYCITTDWKTSPPPVCDPNYYPMGPYDGPKQECTPPQVCRSGGDGVMECVNPE